ncbi:hypothetical protein [Streptomyces montanisoli]|uniref:hypothetical protein n=1 Tax=Streptomyces montanisoli TaxID=2798581 RepID=UPI001FD72FBD|nr:hypothetical protein [Streptomyces montanisoli]
MKSSLATAVSSFDDLMIEDLTHMARGGVDPITAGICLCTLCVAPEPAVEEAASATLARYAL